MIFYFTGTGNSWYAAKRLLSEGEQLIDMKACVKQRKYRFRVAENESVGFVFPVYYAGLPTLVHAFTNRLCIDGIDEKTHVYAVITCGSMIGNAGGMLKTQLANSGIRLSAVYSLVMPENYALMYQTPAAEEIEESLKAADKKLKAIKDSVKEKRINNVEGTLAGKVMTSTIYPIYGRGRRTAPFYADDNCVGCGICAGRCPVGAIKMVAGKPHWIKEQCVMCMACCRCGAIQYGDKMKNHRRYVNPEFKKATSCH